MPTISPIIRITIGLLLLTISILLIGDMLGLVPNQNQAKIEARKTMSESLAIQVSSEIGSGRIDNAIELLNVIVKRSDDIVSMGLRDTSQKLVMQTREHKEAWVSREDDQSTITNVQVPIFDRAGRWGTLEVVFVPLNSMIEDFFNGRSLVTMILFIFVSGFITYWLFLKRVLSELDPSSVVPDRVRSALDTLMEGLVILDSSERIIFVNEAFKKKVALKEEQLLAKNLSDLDWQREDESLSLENKKMPWSILFETGEVPEIGALRLKTQNDEVFIFNVNIAPIKEPNDKIKGAVVTIDDITELEKKNRELAQILERLESSQEEISRQNKELIELATKDPLTNLFNRRSLFEGFDALLLEARNTADVISCVILDIDHFKNVNDTYGHGVGDDVIRIFAKILQDSVRGNDIVGRYGGEEFVLVMPGMYEGEAAQAADRVRIQICEKVHDGLPEDLWIASSFGVSSTTTGVWESDNLIDLADKALYVAKDTGRNRVVRYSQMDEEHTQVEVEVAAQPAVPPISRTTKPKIEAIKEEERELANIELINEAGQIPIETFDKISVLSRTVILDRLVQAIKLAKREETNLTVLTIYIDNIKPISNVIGHAGAEKLRKIAYERLIDTFRSSDSVIPDIKTNKGIGLSRASDSEFIAILPGIVQPSITTWVVERMLKDVSDAVVVEGTEIVMSSHVGASVYPMDADGPEELLSNSNIALQNSIKKEGESFLFYDAQMNEQCKYELEIEAQLHQALKRDEFYLDYQPIVNLQTGRVNKFEALLRWKHPKLGLVSPESFIEIAENAGTIKSIGAWVFNRACKQLKVWQNSGYPHLKMSINLSVVQFNQVNLAEDIIQTIEEVGVSPSSIVLEMTETVLLKEHDSVINILNTLDAAGIQIALDDFGTGYSSLEYLRKFPISIIKIDRSLINEFPRNLNDVSIVSALINLSHNLGMSVITEGVEDETQLSALADLGSDEIQGYFISRPLKSKDVGEYLDSTHTRKLVRRANISKSVLEERESRAVALAEILNAPPS